MFSSKTLQTKLVVSVFFIVIFTVLSMTGLVMYIEKKQYQERELDRIFYKAEAMKIRLGHLMYGKNWRYLMMTLSNAKAADPSLLFFVLTDTRGKVVIADNAHLVGRDRFDLTQSLEPDTPVYTRGKDASGGPAPFRIFLSRYSPEGTGARNSGGSELIFEAVYEIVYMDKPMGQFRAGFTRKPMDRHLAVLFSGMLGTGVLVLLGVLTMIYLVIKHHMIPVESFINHISGLGLTRNGKSFKESFADILLEEQPGETRDVRQLKQAFLHTRNQFVLAWDQLENHRNNLEEMVAERTLALNRSNAQLSRQIRERKEIESRVLNVQKLEAIGTLAGGVAHEFNNLFMAITGYATLIQKHSRSGHPNIEKAEKIRQLVETGALLVQQLLGFARSGKFDPGPLNLNEVLRVSLVILASSRKDLDFKTDYAQNLGRVHGDRSQMEQVTMNLLLNAAEATSHSGTITIRTRNRELENFSISVDKTVSGRFVMVSVADNGAGIDPDILPRIFDPFFTTKAMGLGSGMGLASVFGIVKNHGGFITAESDNGRGSLFTVYLPALKESGE